MSAEGLREIRGLPGDIVWCRRTPGLGAAHLTLRIVREQQVLAVDTDPAHGQWHILPAATGLAIGDLWAEGYESLGSVGPDGTARLRLVLERDPEGPLEAYEMFDGQETHSLAARDLPEAVRLSLDSDLVSAELEGLSVALQEAKAPCLLTSTVQ